MTDSEVLGVGVVSKGPCSHQVAELLQVESEELHQRKGWGVVEDEGVDGNPGLGEE